MKMKNTEKHLRMMIKVIGDAHDHIQMGTPNRVWSTYFRYALNELEKGSVFLSRSISLDPKQKSIHEHTVPFKIVRDKLLDLNDVTIESVSETLDKFHIVSRISIEEDQKLKNANLNTKMPEGWDGINPFARYEAVGILINE